MEQMILPTMYILTDDVDSYKWKGTAHLSFYPQTLDVPPAVIAKNASLACWTGCNFHFPSSVDKDRHSCSQDSLCLSLNVSK